MENNETFIIKKAPVYIDNITQDMEPKWGRMSAQHMVEHLGVLFLISGKKVEPYSLPKEKQEKYYKDLTSGSFQFKKNTASPVLPDDPLPLRFQTLSKAKNAAIKALHGFEQHFKDHPDDKVEHPVFGQLNYDEWLLFHELHLKHHFKQFGLID